MYGGCWLYQSIKAGLTQYIHSCLSELPFGKALYLHVGRVLSRLKSCQRHGSVDSVTRRDRIQCDIFENMMYREGGIHWIRKLNHWSGLINHLTLYRLDFNASKIARPILSTCPAFVQLGTRSFDLLSSLQLSSDELRIHLYKISGKILSVLH